MRGTGLFGLLQGLIRRSPHVVGMRLRPFFLGSNIQESSAASNARGTALTLLWQEELLVGMIWLLRRFRGKVTTKMKKQDLSPSPL